jgi:large subunit ribosomal protein L6
MSRIGKLPIDVPNGVKVNLTDNVITLEGPKGLLSRQLINIVNVELAEGKLLVTRNDDEKKSRSYHGMTRTLLNNMVRGVTDGFQTVLDITGVGYRAEVKGSILALSLGYSHPIDFPIPEGITIEVEKMTKIFVRGADKELVGQTSAKIRSFREPEPYKGKGIRYSDEKILRKAGKTGKK